MFQIELPPLRERPEDIAAFAEKLLTFFGRSRHRAFVGFTKEALTRQGVSDEPRETPIDMVVLIVSPSSAPDEQIRILALASRASQSRQLRDHLRLCVTPDEAMKVITEWRSEE